MDSFIGERVVIGNGCNIQPGAFIPDNVELGDDVFIGPHAVFTNDKYPPSHGEWMNDPPTVVGNGASIGANSTILPGIVIGEYAVVGAGSVVTKDVPAWAIVYGNPAV